MKGEPTTFAGLYRAETDELSISLNFRHKKHALSVSFHSMYFSGCGSQSL